MQTFQKNLPSEPLFDFAITFQATFHLTHTLQCMKDINILQLKTKLSIVQLSYQNNMWAISFFSSHFISSKINKKQKKKSRYFVIGFTQQPSIFLHLQLNVSCPWNLVHRTLSIELYTQHFFIKLLIHKTNFIHQNCKFKEKQKIYKLKKQCLI